ncbi:MAG: hypothetical protein HOD60_14525 [Candidatus Nitrosopelagicus sp.]|jgi:hypothetical protein|nr:hypothetical protein [Candidatus Nitrosopelagicus sp.]
MKDAEINSKLIQIIKENNSNPKGISKTELARVFIERWGSSKNMIWDYIIDLIDTGKVEFRKVTKSQYTLFYVP